MSAERLPGERTRPTLRAIRREPLLVDDRVVMERLDAALPADVARWGRAWLVCWFATLSSDERFGRVDPWEIPIRLDAVALPKGAGDHARQRAVVDALTNGGLASAWTESAPNGRRSLQVVQLERDVFAEHPAALAVDWATVVSRSGAEPAALLVVRALADLIVPIDATAAVPRRDLVARTGYQQKQVRVALRRLVAADLVGADGDVGTTARYHFTARTLGRPWSEGIHVGEPPVAPPLAAQPAAASAPSPVPNASSASSASSASDASGVRLVIGGATVTVAAGASFEIGAGLAARLELGPDGQPRLVVDPTSR
jgi:hypothetical protein